MFVMANTMVCVCVCVYCACCVCMYNVLCVYRRCFGAGKPAFSLRASPKKARQSTKGERENNNKEMNAFHCVSLPHRGLAESSAFRAK